MAIFAIFGGAFVSGQSGSAMQEVDENSDGKTDQWIEIIDSETTKVTKDRDFDGRPDYELVYDDLARKITEVIDFNFDGEMDDFYFFENGVLTRRELDTNYNQKIDLWVFLVKGIYISRIERDIDEDGEIDYEKDYGIDTDT